MSVLNRFLSLTLLGGAMTGQSKSIIFRQITCLLRRHRASTERQQLAELFIVRHFVAARPRDNMCARSSHQCSASCACPSGCRGELEANKAVMKLLDFK